MNINRYITRGISETITRPSNLTLEYGKRTRQSTSYRLPTHFKLQEDDNISITHEQEQPAYKLNITI